MIMENVLLEDFYHEINQIREYLNHIEYVDKVSEIDTTIIDNESIKGLLNKLLNHHIKFSRDKKVFEYKAIIISLYGIIEKYIEIWIKDFLETIPSIVPYNLLSNDIQNNHFEYSMKLISMVIEGRWNKYEHLRKESILKKLNNCIENPVSYQINSDAFVVQSGNLTHKRITDIFKVLGIRLNDSLIKNHALNEKIGLSEDRISRTEKDVLYGVINNIVDRRNKIAHGAERIDDLLTNSVLKTYIDFLEKYCHGVFEALQGEFIRYESIHQFQQIEVVHNVWQSAIVGFELEKYFLRKGDFLIIKTADNQFHKKPILEIQKDKEVYSELKIDEKINIGVKVEPRINSNCTFYLKKQNP